MLSSSALPLAFLATLTTVSAGGFGAQHQHGAIRRAPSHHWSRSNLPGRVNSARPRMARRGSSEEPSTLSEGALTAAEGCTKWYHVASGDSCYSAIATVEGGLSLEDFYSMNPQVNSDCFNLWAGFDYCVARTTSSAVSAPTVKAAAPVENKAVVRTSSASPSPSPSPAPVVEAVAEDDDEDCEVDDEEDVATTAAAPAATQNIRVVHAAQTTAAPAVDDSAAKAAASKSSADAAWAASSKASADAAWAASESSKAAAQAQAAATTTAAPATTTKVADTSSSGNAQSKLSAMGVKTFLGKQTGAIASWFRTNSAQDSTNGHSWCYRPYSDSLPLFAPSLKTMLASVPNNDPIAAGKLFCGLEAIVSTPDGKSATMFIGDAFDDRWVLTPTSIDVAYGAFWMLFGRETSNKNDVVQGVTWELTGNRRSDYVFNNGNPV